MCALAPLAPMELQNGRQKVGTWIFAPNGQFLFRCMARIYGLVDACYCAHHALKIDGGEPQQVWPQVWPCGGSVGGAAAQAAQLSSPCCAEDREGIE